MFRSDDDPGHGVIDLVTAAFAGTPVKWFYHHAVGQRVVVLA